MMGKVDLSEFYVRPSKKCRAASLVEELEPDAQEKFHAACDEPTISSSTIKRWLGSQTEKTICEGTVRLHRLKLCACYG